MCQVLNTFIREKFPIMDKKLENHLISDLFDQVNAIKIMWLTEFQSHAFEHHNTHTHIYIYIHT